MASTATAMATLSDEEFQRLQEQLLELKSGNYSLEDKIKKQENEINFWKTKCESLEKQSLNPLTFARNLTRNSTKDKELIEKLLQEIASLQQKIDTQEADFRVTNETLRQEIAILNLKSNESVKSILQDSSEITLTDEEKTRAPNFSYSFLAEKEEMESKINCLSQQLDKLSQENESLNNRLQSLGDKEQKLKNVELELQNATALSESREDVVNKMKSTIEELQKEKFVEVNELKLQFESRIDELSSKLVELELENEKLSMELKARSNVEEELSVMALKCTELQQELETQKFELNKCKEEYQCTVDSLSEEKTKEISFLEESFTNEKEILSKDCEFLRNEVNSNEEMISDLQQQIKDIIEERKIHEKKGLMMVKELKRQLNSERKRAENLQEKLQETLNEKCSTVTVDIQPKSQNNYKDSSSVGSWSFMSSKENGAALSVNSSSDSKQASPVRTADEFNASTEENGSQLEQENAQLVARITELQQEKWFLEERINQLEVNNAKLNEDVSEKRQLIEYYCMEGRCDPSPHHSTNLEKLTVKRVFDFIKAKGDENLKDINRRLVRMLEETLTKNMHLEENLEMLSQENVRLAKCVHSNAD